MELIIVVIMVVVGLSLLSSRRRCGGVRPRQRQGAHALPWLDPNFNEWNKRQEDGELGLDGRDKGEPYAPQPVKAGNSEIERVVEAHADCTAETFSIIVTGRRRVERTYSMMPGDRVVLKRYDGKIKVYGRYAGTDVEYYINDLYLPETSLLPKVFEENIPIEAFLGGRDLAISTKDMEFLTIIVFYHIEGVLPTKVNLHF